jgi:hypothetical protein
VLVFRGCDKIPEINNYLKGRRFILAQNFGDFRPWLLGLIILGLQWHSTSWWAQEAGEVCSLHGRWEAKRKKGKG